MPSAASTIPRCLLVKWDPLSDLMTRGTPYLGISSFLNHLITVLASSHRQGIASSHLVYLSTITNMYLYPCTRWSAPISVKSMHISLNGASGTGKRPMGHLYGVVGKILWLGVSLLKPHKAGCMPLFGDVFLQTGTADGRTQQKTQKMISPPPYLF